MLRCYLGGDLKEIQRNSSKSLYNFIQICKLINTFARDTKPARLLLEWTRRTISRHFLFVIRTKNRMSLNLKTDKISGFQKLRARKSRLFLKNRGIWEGRICPEKVLRTPKNPSNLKGLILTQIYLRNENF